MLWSTLLVPVNAAYALRRIRAGSIASTVLGAFGLRLALDVPLAVLSSIIASGSATIPDAVFLGVLFSVIITAYDIHRPVYEWRERSAEA